MAPSRTRQRLQHDRDLLCRMLEDYEGGAIAHLDEREQASIVESIQQRIADIDARMEAFDRE
jgi:hypothetical protein